MELMVTIVVMGIIAGIAAPTVTGFINSSRLSGAANTLMGDLHYAHTLASGQRRTYELRTDSTRYTIVRTSPDSVVVSRTLAGGLRFGARDTTSFFAWGLNEAATFTVSHGGSSKIVRITTGGRVSRD